MNDHTTTNGPRVADNPAAWVLAQHIADHPMSTVQAAFRYLNAPLTVELHEQPASVDQAAPAAWVDGHPQLELIAAAVWEKCGRSDSGMCVEDDPRNIAVAALAAVLPATTNHDTDTSTGPLCRDAEGCHRVVPCDPGCGTRDLRAEATRPMPAPVDRAAVLREAADLLAAKRQVYGAPGANIHRRSPLRVQGMADAEAELRRVADETAATETPDEAWQREWDRRPDGADVSDLFEIVAVVPCSGTLFSAHQPHTWEPQPGVPAVHCPGERQPATGARQDGAQR